MFIDASALVAILAREAGWEELAFRIEQTETIAVSSLSIWETVRGLYRSHEMSLETAETIVMDFVRENSAAVAVIDYDVGETALRASRLFGRGRHSAALNMGDCFAYACAKTLGVALLAKGNDFPQTDIELA
jgi:ribonuclease VapC